MPKTAEQFELIRSERRKAILNVALKLFSEKGYVQTSISEVAKEAGISKGLIYNYFFSKEEVLNTIMRDFIHEMTRLMDPNQDDVIEDQEVVRLFDHYFELMLTRQEEMKLYYQLSLQPEVLKILMSDEMLQTGNKYRQLYIEYFRTKFGKEADVIMLNLISIFKGFSLIYSLTPGQYSKELVERYKEYLKKTFLTDLKTGPDPIEKTGPGTIEKTGPDPNKKNDETE